MVGPVVSQGNCGSCYAFSAVSVVESMLAVITDKYQPLPVQQVVDCSGQWDVTGVPQRTCLTTLETQQD